MKYVLRIKAVSECMRIRRCSICYHKYEDSVIDLSTQEHPLNKFKLTLIGDDISDSTKTEKITLGEEVYFSKNRTVDTGSSTELERNVLGVMLVPLDIEMKDYYLEQIKEGYTFDQWYGEFEYLLGLMYELCENNLELANEYYDLAKSKGFKYNLVR